MTFLKKIHSNLSLKIISIFLPKYIKYFYELYMNIWISIFDKCLSLSEWNLNIKH